MEALGTLKASACSWYTVTFAHIPLNKASNWTDSRTVGWGSIISQWTLARVEGKEEFRTSNAVYFMV